MAISDTTLNTDVWAQINTTLLAASIVASVISGSTSSTTLASVIGSFNDKHLNHPQVVVEPIRISEKAPKFGGTYGVKAIDVLVSVYHPNGRAVDSMADQVRGAIQLSPPQGMTLVGIEDEPDFASPGDNKIKSRAIVFHFDREV